jgi:sugar phosphate isomerase/epimerase
MKKRKIGWVVTSIQNLSVIKNFELDHCEIGFFHQNEKTQLLETIPNLSCNYGYHFPIFRFGETIPSSTEYALLDFNDTRSEFFFKNVEDDARLTSETNGKYLLVHLQRFFRLFSEKITVSESKFWELALKKGERLRKIQEKYNIQIVLEGLCGCNYLYAPEHYMKFIITYPQFGFCIDISHIQLDKWIFAINSGSFVDRLKSKISHIHLNNFQIPENDIPFSRHNFFQHYKKGPVNLSQNEANGHADVKSILQLLMTKSSCKFYTFEHNIPELNDRSAMDIHELIQTIRTSD